MVKLLAGKTELRKGKKRIITHGEKDGKAYFIDAGEVHGFSTFDQPVSFLVRETWLDGVVPDSIENNWVGEPLAALNIP